MRKTCCLCFLLCAWWVSILHAQLSPSTQDALQLVPPDGIALVTLQVKSIVQDESMRMLPWEVMAAVGKSEWGLDPMSIERVDLVACVPAPNAIRAGGLITLSQDIAPEFLEQFEPDDTAANQGVELYALPGNMDLYLNRRDARHLLVGTRAFLLAAVKTKPREGALRKLVSGLGEPGALSITIALDPVREIVSGNLQAAPLPAPIAQDIQTIVDKAELIAFRGTLGNASNLATLIQTKSPSDATEVSAAAARLIKQGTQAMIAGVQTQATSEDGRLPKATMAYLQRLAPEIEQNVVFKANGNRLVMNLNGSQLVAGQMGIGVGLLLPAVQAARDAARRMQSMNNLKQIMLAHFNYESAFKRMPADKDLILDSKTQGNMEANLSWRVHILPYIEQVALYNEFHLDEPWDSPHNIKLLERMPEVYRHNNAKTKPGYTVYQRPTGQGLSLDPKNWVRLGSITDGTSNTIFVIETKDEVAVPWTKPGDVNPLEDLSVLRVERGVSNVAMGDGSVRALPSKLDAEKLKGLFTINGGEVVSLE